MTLGECLRNVAAALNVSVDILMGSLARSADLTPAERKLLKRFRALDDARKRDILRICEMFAEETENGKLKAAYKRIVGR